MHWSPTFEPIPVPGDRNGIPRRYAFAKLQCTMPRTALFRCRSMHNRLHHKPASIGRFVLVSCTLIATTACTPHGDHRPKDVLVIGQTGEPKSLDPHVATSLNDFRILVNVYEGSEFSFKRNRNPTASFTRPRPGHTALVLGPRGVAQKEAGPHGPVKEGPILALAIHRTSLGVKSDLVHVSFSRFFLLAVPGPSDQESSRRAKHRAPSGHRQSLWTGYRPVEQATATPRSVMKQTSHESLIRCVPGCLFDVLLDKGIRPGMRSTCIWSIRRYRMPKYCD